MGWGLFGRKKEAESQPDVVERQKAEETLAVLFHNKPCVVTSKKSSAVVDLVPASPAPASEDAFLSTIRLSSSSDASSSSGPSDSSSSWWSALFQRGGKKETPPPAEADSHVPPQQDAAYIIDWTLLPPSPVAGLKVAADGLHDEFRDREGHPKPLTQEELRSLIVESSSLEAKAQYSLDVSLVQHVTHRSRRGVEYVLSPVIGIYGLYTLLIKFSQHYRHAVPRESILFTSELLQSMTGVARYSESEVEQFCRRRGWLLRLSNRHPVSSMLGGIILLVMSAYTWEPFAKVQKNDAADLGRDQVSYHMHTKTAAQWLWTVYYHHPAYRTDATTVVPLISSASPRYR